MIERKYDISCWKRRVVAPNCPIATQRTLAHGGAMPSHSPLDDPENARFAWTRYKRLMRFMLAITLLVTAAAVALVYWQNGPVSVHFYIATGLGIGVAMMLTSALMGLVFLSNGTGHDDSVIDPTRDRDKR